MNVTTDQDPIYLDYSGDHLDLLDGWAITDPSPVQINRDQFHSEVTTNRGQFPPEKPTSAVPSTVRESLGELPTNEPFSDQNGLDLLSKATNRYPNKSKNPKPTVPSTVQESPRELPLLTPNPAEKGSDSLLKSAVLNQNISVKDESYTVRPKIPVKSETKTTQSQITPTKTKSTKVNPTPKAESKNSF